MKIENSTVVPLAPLFRRHLLNSAPWKPALCDVTEGSGTTAGGNGLYHQQSLIISKHVEIRTRFYEAELSFV